MSEDETEARREVQGAGRALEVALREEGTRLLSLRAGLSPSQPDPCVEEESCKRLRRASLRPGNKPKRTMAGSPSCTKRSGS